MKACGIIVEYNPFHNGHLYHIEQARAITGCDVLIAVMSSSAGSRQFWTNGNGRRRRWRRAAI